MERGTRLRVPEKRGLVEQVYEILKQQILDQELGPGTKLNIDRLSRKLGVSSSPIREALARLTAEKLVQSELYSGYVVAPPPSIEYLENLLDYRIVLEGHCARHGAPLGNAAALKAMKAAMRKMSAIPRIGSQYEEYRTFIGYDAAFHEALVDSVGNRVMSEQYRSVNAIILQSRLYLNRSGGISSDEVLREHAAILAAFEKRDGTAAEEALRAHLDGGRRRLLRQPARPDADAPNEPEPSEVSRG